MYNEAMEVAEYEGTWGHVVARFCSGEIEDRLDHERIKKAVAERDLSMSKVYLHIAMEMTDDGRGGGQLLYDYDRHPDGSVSVKGHSGHQIWVGPDGVKLRYRSESRKEKA